MSDLAERWPKHLHDKAQATQSAGFGLAGLVATGAVLVVLAGFGAIAVVAGGNPKGSGTEITGQAVATAAIQTPPAGAVADEPRSAADQAAGADGAQMERLAPRTQASPVAMAEAEREMLAPAAVRTYKVAPDGRIVKDEASALEVSALPAGDPRWAQDIGTPVANGKRALARLLVDSGDKPEAGRDNPLTSAIAPVDRAMAAAPLDEAKPAPEPASAGKTGYANRHVNMRAGPSNDAKVITVIPAKARVTIHGCKGWCEISHEGRRGFVYKTFIKQG